MIRSLRLKNFKAFQETGVLQLKPLTVLAGANSGGKSSILQSLLLLKQTLEGPPDIHLNLDGTYLQFSAFKELTFGMPSPSRCEVSYEFHIETPMPGHIVPRYFTLNEFPSEDTEAPLLSKIRLTFRYNRLDKRQSIILHHFEVSSYLNGVEGPHFRGTFRNGNYRTIMRGKSIRNRGLIRDRKINSVDLMHFRPYLLTLDDDEESDHPSRLPLDPIFRIPLSALQEELKENLKYLGPLRERPKRAYLHSGSPLSEIGESGQYAAQILWLEKDDMINYLPERGQDTKTVTLMTAVNEAFQRLGMLQPVDVNSEKSIMYQILFRLGEAKSQDAVTIADVGFGVSQLLPILVLGLRSDPSSLLLLEQPEIHLHPRVQANMADFLLALTEQGIRVIVETHSDHFINRLRRRIAEDATDGLADKVSILFVNPPQGVEGASIDPLHINRFGVIDNWPPDFLPEAADEAQAIFAAGLKKREE